MLTVAVVNVILKTKICDCRKDIEMKRIVNLFFFVSALLSALSVFADVPDGSEGNPWLVGSPRAEDVVVYTNEVNTLIIKGTGAMVDYEWQGDVPWKGARGVIARVEICSGVTNIGGYAFYRCVALKSVTIPNSVTRIGASAFAHCSAIVDVEIPEGVTEIGESAFYSCGALKNFTIPAGVTQINALTFSWCENLEVLILMPTTPPLISSGSAFSNCTNLRMVYVPTESVEAYRQAPGWATFAERIQPIPPPGHRNNPWRIGSPNAKDILAYIEDNTLFINGKGAMIDFESETETPWHGRSMDISTIKIGAGITHLGDCAFANCLGVTQISSVDEIPPQGGNGAFTAIPSHCRWLVPCGAVAAYTSANATFKWQFQGSFVEYYSVGITPAVHGKVSVNWSTLLFGGEEIQVTTVPDEQYYLASLIYFDGEEHDILKTMSFIMPKTDVTITATFETSAQGSPLNPWKIGDTSDDKVIAYTNNVSSLVIDGTGATKDFSSGYHNSVPWQEFRESITTIIVEPEVKYLGVNIFNGCDNLSRIILKSPTVINAGTSAFDFRSYKCIAYVPYGLKAGYEEKCKEQMWNFAGDFVEYYSVEVLPSENGSVTVDKPFVLTTDEKTVTAKAYPAENCRLVSLVYFDGENHDITETMRFTMPSKNVTMTAVFAKLGTKGYPWQVNDNVTAYVEKDGTLVIEGVGAITSAPWKPQARGVIALQVGEGITDFGESLSTLPNLKRINGLALITFSSAAVGAAKAAGISAFAVDSETRMANLKFAVKTAPSIHTDKKDWQTAAEVPVAVRADGAAGFFVITTP